MKNVQNILLIVETGYKIIYINIKLFNIEGLNFCVYWHKLHLQDNFMPTSNIISIDFYTVCPAQKSSDAQKSPRLSY